MVRVLQLLVFVAHLFQFTAQTDEVALAGRQLQFAGFGAQDFVGGGGDRLTGFYLGAAAGVAGF